MIEYTSEAYEKSIELLTALVSPDGFYAADADVTNYGRVWGRDGVIAGLAAMTTDNTHLHDAFRRTLITHRDNQDETGRTPSNVDPRTSKVSYGTTVGRIDATIWYVLGVCQYSLRTDDREFFESCRSSVDRALFYLKCLDLNGRGLLYIPQGADWADEYVNHGYVLFDQILYYHALQSYYGLTHDPEVEQRAKNLRNLILVNYFPIVENTESEYVYHDVLFKESVKKWEPPLPLTYFSNYNASYTVDNFANALILLSDIPSYAENQTADMINRICEAVSDCCVNTAFPIIPAFHPVIQEGDEKWEMLINNYLFTFRNFPNHYHNGGLWPLVHGFFLTAKRSDARESLERFAAILARDKYIFPEYYHGETYAAEGVERHGFTASAYILAYNAAMNNELPFVYK